MSSWSGHLLSRLRLLILLTIIGALAHAVWSQSGETVYRITVLKGVGDKEARDYRLVLESLGYIPVYLSGDFKNNNGNVYYGNFPSRKDADKVKSQLVREGFSPGEIIEAKRGLDQTASNLTILVDDYKDADSANRVNDELQKKGHLSVKTYKIAENDYKVTVGNFPSADRAQNVLASLTEGGYTKAKVVPALQGDEMTGSAAPKDKKAELEQDVRSALPKDLKLSEQEMQKIVALVVKQVGPKPADTAGSQVINEINRMKEELRNINVNINDVTDKVKKLQDDREIDAHNRVLVAQLFRDSSNLAKGKKFDEAITKLEDILKLDPNNQLAEQRKRVLAEVKTGGLPEDQRVQLEQQYDALKATAQANERANTIPSLTTALANWDAISSMNKQYAEEAEKNKAQLQIKIQRMQEEKDSIAKSGNDQGGRLTMIMGGAVTLLIVVIVFLIWFNNKRHREVLQRIQEATSLRPMRGIPTGRRAADWSLSEGSGGGQLPSPEGFEGYDPLAADPEPAPPSNARGPISSPMASSPASSHAPAAAAGSLIDDLFTAEPEPLPQPSASRAATTKPAPRPAAVADSGGFDGILGNSSATATAPTSDHLEDSGSHNLDHLFATDEQPTKQAKPSAAAKRQKELEESHVVSLDDILGIGPAQEAPAAQTATAAAPKAAPAPKVEQSPLSVFDEIETVVPTRADMGRKPEPVPSMEEDPLDSLLNFDSKPSQMKTVPVRSGGTKTVAVAKSESLDIPALRAEPVPGDPLGSMAFSGEETVKETITGAMASQKIDLSAKGLASAESPEAAETIGGVEATSSHSGNVIFNQDFEAEKVGQKPRSWEGEFPYATLSVQNEAPKNGAGSYLAYSKKDGVGKVYYSTKFPNASGVVSVDFDLRCNDKNKFLLGFYIEKDGDFQQSIHTKILRSESQTAPSIHIHGQPTPYMLGTWAHIRYIIDLVDGKVDGYVDDRHVAKSVQLAQVPKYLNTLAIRDNINTTGQLFIDNIVVQKIG